MASRRQDEEGASRCIFPFVAHPGVPAQIPTGIRKCRASVTFAAALSLLSVREEWRSMQPAPPSPSSRAVGGVSREAVTSLVMHRLSFAVPPSDLTLLTPATYGVSPSRESICSKHCLGVFLLVCLFCFVKETLDKVLLQEPFYWSPCFCTTLPSLF